MASTQVADENGAYVLRDCITSDFRRFVTQMTLFDELQDYSPTCQQVPNSHTRYCSPATESLTLMIQPIVEQTIGKQVYPTFSYSRVYQKGNVLEEHIDRAACEVSATVCMGYSDPWPFFINGKQYDMEPGDIIIFDGVNNSHWREQFNPKQPDGWQVQYFFHYVTEGGPNEQWKYDKREGIGHTHPLSG